MSTIYGYTCTISNITFNSEFDEFVFIGDHLDGKSDEDITGVVFKYSSLKKVPVTIFEQFVNLEFLNVKGTGLKVVDGETFGSCSNGLKWIDASDKTKRSYWTI